MPARTARRKAQNAAQRRWNTNSTEPGDVKDRSAETTKSISPQTKDKPRSSASLKKLGHVLEEKKIVESPRKNTDEAAGYRFRHVTNEHNMLQAVHNKCKGKLKIEEENDKRMGLDSVLKISCEVCELEFTTQSSFQSIPGTWMPQDAKDINNRAVYALTEMGCSRGELLTFCEMMDIPVASGPSTMWENRVSAIKNATKSCADLLLDENRKELFILYDADGKKLLKIPVTYDGTWMTRGWSSSVGVGFILSVDTGKPLDFAIRVNYCQQCRFCPYKKGSPKYLRWYRMHKNTCKYDIMNSKNMEADMAMELREKSTG